MSDSRAIPPEALLENAGWLRRLALRLVRDDARADDLVQEAIVVALDRPPRSTAALRSWLRQVVVRLAYRSRRGDSRRGEREARAARPEAQGESPDEIVARAELHRRLVGLVLELDEPYRSVVILRYLDGLEVDEIARRQGIATPSVRSRLARALAKLRERLDRDFGDPHAWHMACLPIALPSLAGAGPLAVVAAAGTGAGAVAPIAGAITKGVVVMSSKVIAGAAASAVIIVAGGFAVWRASEEPSASTVTPLGRAAVHELARELSELRREVADVQSERSTLEQEVRSLRELVATLDARIGAVERADGGAAPSTETMATPTESSRFADLADLSSAIAANAAVLAKSARREELTPEERAALDVLSGELTKASALARQRLEHPFFDPEFFGELARALFDTSLELDEPQRAAFADLVRDIASGLPEDPGALSPLERHLVRRETVDALTAGLAPLLREDQRELADGVFPYADQVLATAGLLELSIEIPARNLLANVAANVGLEEISPDSPLMPLGESFIARGRELLAEYGPDETAIKALEPARRAELDARLLELQLEVERAALREMDEEARARYFARSPVVIEFRYGGGIAMRGAGSRF